MQEISETQRMDRASERGERDTEREGKHRSVTMMRMGRRKGVSKGKRGSQPGSCPPTEPAPIQLKEQVSYRSNSGFSALAKDGSTRTHEQKRSAPSRSARPGPMAFNDLLQQVGGVGRFQQIQVTLVVLPLLLMASHNTLQNFTAAIPRHHCRPPADANLSQDGELEAWLPRDRQGQPESCLLFTVPQQGPPFPNGTEANSTGATEPCTWVAQSLSICLRLRA